ncbi:MAG: hypothetical protein Q8922_13265 [Bacteroidota bacterium]|nr:hypothetical protein [Bacteroidota bacterium]MDP4232790.1 hypothetical protein [Bacteroidota bacterium]MDP4242529.1 hypothetical protein [Bacteroidota bacterium]MDP4288892.1 hypothetical protein [Bacteroidota bacterium]
MRSLRFAVLLSSLVTARCAGFTANGHNVIEATAYRHLLSRANIERLSAIAGRTFSGKDALDALIAYRILDQPRRWGKNAVADPLNSLPIVRSGNLDMVLSRQFEGNSQCFHFLARSSDVYWDTTTDPIRGYPHMLYDSAYPRCVAFITSMFQQVLNNALAARAGDHDVYGLMHSVADSYSEAHVERDSLGRIVYCRFWQPTAIIPFFLHPSAERFYFGPWHHKFTDHRDAEYWREIAYGVDCSSAKNPYQVDDSCLSQGALRAADALEELLIVLCENVLHEQRDHRIDTGYEARSWQRYLDEFFVGWKSQARERKLREDEREWRPLLHAGVDFHQTAPTGDGTARDYSLVLNLDVPVPTVGPVTPALIANYGIREYADHSTAPLLRLGYSLVFQFADDFDLRVTPFEREFVFGTHIGETRNLISFFQIEGIIDRRLWLRAEIPRFTTTGWIKNDFGFSAGWSDSWDLGEWFSELIGTREPMPFKGEAWKVPAAAEIKSAHIGTGMSFSITPINFEFTQFANRLYGGSLQVLWDRNSSGERNPGFANGVELDYSLSAELGYVLRYHFSPHFAITTEPINFEKSFLGSDPHPSGDLHWDIQTTLGVTVLLTHTDVTLGLMRFSWRDAFDHQSPFYQGIPAGLRIGASFFVP